MYYVHCIVYSVHCTLYSAYCTNNVDSVYCELCIEEYASHIVYYEIVCWNTAIGGGLQPHIQARILCALGDGSVIFRPGYPMGSTLHLSII